MTGPGERMRERAACIVEAKITMASSVRNSALRSVVREIRALPSGDWESVEEAAKAARQVFVDRARELGIAPPTLRRWDGSRHEEKCWIAAVRAVLEGPKL